MEQKAQSDESYIKRMADEIDPKELEKAMNNGVGLMRGALFATSQRGMAIVRPVLSTGWFMVRFVFGSFTRRLLGQRKGGQS